MPDFNQWLTYLPAGAFAAYIAKTQIQHGRDIVALQTTIKYYVERQTNDAVERLDKGNPAPPHIRDLARKHVRGMTLTTVERDTLFDWLKWTGTGNNPEADSAERSAALQLLTGIKTQEMLDKSKRRWWQFA